MQPQGRGGTATAERVSIKKGAEIDAKGQRERQRTDTKKADTQATKTDTVRESEEDRDSNREKGRVKSVECCGNSICMPYLRLKNRFPPSMTNKKRHGET
eukprot:GEMP01127919.1.p1 GENE.GEMP01127919.1~~GEMP01127919.1.p1  ORF type:complete len:100 (+),score=3.77 GEMP01127919.1:39-338(+)